MLKKDNINLKDIILTDSYNYPPYNIEIDGKSNMLKITLAVAGFSIKDLKVSIQGAHLYIRGYQSRYLSNFKCVYQGISQKNFYKKFILLCPMIVHNIFISNGLLEILLFQNYEEKILNINIKDQ